MKIEETTQIKKKEDVTQSGPQSIVILIGSENMTYSMKTVNNSLYSIYRLIQVFTNKGPSKKLNY